jgi:hypothetical protein
MNGFSAQLIFTLANTLIRFMNLVLLKALGTWFTELAQVQIAQAQ